MICIAMMGPPKKPIKTRCCWNLNSKLQWYLLRSRQKQNFPNVLRKARWIPPSCDLCKRNKKRKDASRPRYPPVLYSPKWSMKKG